MGVRGQRLSEKTRKRISDTKRAKRPTHCKRGHEFTPDNTMPDKGDGRRRCKACANILAGEFQRRLRQTDPNRVHNKELHDKHGITLERKAQLIEDQGNKCAACGTSIPGGKFNSWQLDHDHSCCPRGRSCERCRRGFLCAPCNLALGCVKDSIEHLLRLAAYLQQWENRNG